jgi:hypothetical protein
MKKTFQSNAETYFGCRGKHIAFAILVFACIPLFFSRCATFQPQKGKEAFSRSGAVTKRDGNIRVTAAVLSPEETKAFFDLDLYDKGIQPVWLEIENRNDSRVWFPPISVDPDYFSPLEVAYMNFATFAKKRNRRMAEFIYDHALKRLIAPGTTQSGFVFTNLNLGTKAFNVDLVGEKSRVWTFTFYISVPGFRASHQDVDWENLYPKDEILSLDNMEDLKESLANLPYWTKNQDGTKQGVPINIIIVGHGKDLHHVLLRRGWDETAGVKPVPRSEGPIPSRYAPVRPLYVYGRHQDAAFRKTRERVNERNQLRLWLSPIRFKEKLVWIGQISREVKVRYLPDTYRIEPLVDEARTYLLQDLWYSQRLEKFGYVKGVAAKFMSEPYEDLAGNPYFTDGFCTVLWIAEKPLSFAEVEALEWGTLAGLPGDND